MDSYIGIIVDGLSYSKFECTLLLFVSHGGFKHTLVFYLQEFPAFYCIPSTCRRPSSLW